MTEQNSIISDELISTLAESVITKWVDDPPYELRGALVNAVRVKLEGSDLVDDIARLVEERLAERKVDIAEAAVKAVIDGVAESLKGLYRDVAKNATKAAEKAFSRY